MTSSPEVSTKKKRVCLIRQAVYPSTTPLLKREADTLHRNGYDVFVITQRGYQPTKPRHFEIQDGIRVYRLMGGRKKRGMVRYIYEYGFFFLQVVLVLTWLHLRFRFRAIQVNTMPDFLIFTTLIPKLLGVPIISMMKEPVPELWETIYQRPPAKWLIRIEQWAIRYSTIVFTVTEELRRRYIERGGDPDKIKVLLNVPDCPRWIETAQSQAQTRPMGHYNILYHGTIEDRYGHEHLLRAIKRVRKSIPEIRLNITGHGSGIPALLKQIRALELEDCVSFHGWVAFGTLVQTIQTSHIGIVALKSSPYSNLIHTGKMYEYILFNKPIVHARLDAVNASFDDDAICYYEPADADHLAHCLLTLYRQPDKRYEMARRARQVFDEKYVWSKHQADYLAVIDDLTS